MAEYIKFRRDDAAAWAAVNPVLRDGEIGLERNAGVYNKSKVGDGVTAWNDLAYLIDNSNAVTNSVKVDVIGFQNIPAFNIVTSTGKVGDVNDYNTRNRIVGISSEAINNGFPGKVVALGVITNPAWSWTKGDIIYVGVNGEPTNIVPSSTYIQVVGTALAPDAVNVQIQSGILI